MRALTVEPGAPGSARLEEIAEPPESDGEVLVQSLAVGICGTDREIVAGAYGRAPEGRSRLVLGHECLGRVLDAPASAGLHAGQLVSAIVRRPDPVPCPSCAAGEWDMCRNGLYTERGILGRDGYASERFRIEARYLVRVDRLLGDLGVLIEPASVLAKAWEHIERIGTRAMWAPERALITGAGPIGLLAAMMAVQRGLDTHVLDHAESGTKPDLVRALGATYCSGSVPEGDGYDVVVECTGSGQLVFDVMCRTRSGAIVCLTGVSSGGRKIGVDAGALNRTMVLENQVVLGTVNANRRHYEAGARALVRADRTWLSRLVTRRVPLARWEEALTRRRGDVKVVLDLEARS